MELTKQQMVKTDNIMKVYCVSAEDFYDYLEEKNLGGKIDIYSITDEFFKKICKELGWELSLEEFVNEFNCDGNGAPYPATHYIRIM